MGGDGNEPQELNIRTVQGAGEGGRDSISIDLPALTHALERIVVNGISAVVVATRCALPPNMR